MAELGRVFYIYIYLFTFFVVVLVSPTATTMAAKTQRKIRSWEHVEPCIKHSFMASTLQGNTKIILFLFQG